MPEPKDEALPGTASKPGTATKTVTTPTLEKGKTYRFRKDSPTAWWWLRKHDGLQEATVEGTVEEVLGKNPGQMSDSHFVLQLRDRSQKLPADSQIGRSWDNLYIVNVRGRQEMVHPEELEAL